MAKKYSPHANWLRLLEVNTPVFSCSVLDEVFPQGLEVPRREESRQLEQLYQEWRDLRDPVRNGHGPKGVTAEDWSKFWIDQVAGKFLGWDKYLVDANEIWPNIDCFGPTLRCRALRYKERTRLLFIEYPYMGEKDLSQNGYDDLKKFEEFCRNHNEAPSIGLVTDGESWTLLWVPDDGPIVRATWYASVWRRESALLNGFYTMMSLRVICRSRNSLLDILKDSASAQDLVIDTLGEQVQRAIEVLVQCLDKADAGREKKVLANLNEKTLYEAALTVMMRLVFLLCAEERRLLPFGDIFYDENYAISTLREKLRADADVSDEKTLETRFDAWNRFLALCRAVYEGINHQDLRLPALGGSLFDPDRYPFLVGHVKGESAEEERPLPVDNRTFLYLLEALQVIENSRGAEIVSYGTLDVEQIGHIYEGLLELEIHRAEGVVLRLKANKDAKKPEQSLVALEALRAKGKDALLNELSDNLKMSQRAISKRLDSEIEEGLTNLLLAVCAGNEALVDRIKPFANLLQKDAWGQPNVYLDQSFMVTKGKMRRQTGSYYTPKELAAKIVENTLQPLVYPELAEGKNLEECTLLSPEKILALKVCDPAMGSGAFLVQVCRYLSERVVEAWKIEEAQGRSVLADGMVVDKKNVNLRELLTSNPKDRLVIARRLIAEKCLYGVDKNPMAVELAKLSLWLATMSIGRPFGFLDHCFVSGDSLLGLVDLNDLYQIGNEGALFGSMIVEAVKEAVQFRKEIQQTVILDMKDVECQEEKLRQAEDKLFPVTLLANVLLLEKLRLVDDKKQKAKLLDVIALLSAQISQIFNRDPQTLERLMSRCSDLWRELQGEDISTFHPMHYCLQFPEVFENGGFDAVVGNPPFIGNMHWRTQIGTIGKISANLILGGDSNKVDLSVVFHRRAFVLINSNGFYGMLGTTNISEGKSISAGLEVISKEGVIFNAVKSMKWPGKASINVSIVCASRGGWSGIRVLNNEKCDKIEPDLTANTFLKSEIIKNKIDSFVGINSVFIDDVIVKKGSEVYYGISSESPSLVAPLVNGELVASTPLTSFEIYVLDTREKPLEDIKDESEKAYEFLLSIKQKRMSHILSKGSYESWKARWWQHWNNRAKYFDKYDGSYFYLYSKLTKYPLPRKVIGVLPTDKVLIVPQTFPEEHLILLFSGFQEWISYFRGAKQGKDKINISVLPESFRSYPTPKRELRDEARLFANAFDVYLRNQGGITPAMNLFHDPEVQGEVVKEARGLQQKIDEAVLAAYGWSDFPLVYDFYETEVGIRYGLSTEMRRKLLERLVELNHQYWQDQQGDLTQQSSK